MAEDHHDGGGRLGSVSLVSYIGKNNGCHSFFQTLFLTGNGNFNGAVKDIENFYLPVDVREVVVVFCRFNGEIFRSVLINHKKTPLEMDALRSAALQAWCPLLTAGVLTDKPWTYMDLGTMHHEVTESLRKPALILHQQNQYTIPPFKPQYLAQESEDMALKNSRTISYNKKRVL